MNAKDWKRKIKKAMQDCGTYQESFSAAVDALSEILEQRDRTRTEFMETGGKSVVMHRLDRGSENAKINPLLKIWIDLNAQALNFWNSLGLTGKSFRQMTGTITIQKESDSFEKILEELGI